MSSALAVALASRSYAIKESYRHSGRLEYLIHNVFGTEKHRQQSEKLLNFMIELDVTTVLVSGERVWYRARAAGALLL